MQNDMTKGSPLRLIVLFTLPVLIGNLFQNFYNLVDSVIVGRFLGVNALAAVGATGTIAFLIFGWINGITGGFGIMLAQSFGAGDEKHLRHYTAMSVYLCTAMAVLMAGGLLLANGWILKAMNTPDSIFEDTKSYIGIVYAGIPITIAYNMLASISRSMGDSRTPLIFLVISSVLNIVLDLVFVAVLPMGVEGAAYATVLAQAVSAAACFFYVRKKYEILHLKKEDMKFSWNSAGRLMMMGLPMGLQFSITAIGTMMVQAAVNLLGATYIAAYSACGKITNIVTQLFPSLGITLANYVGQNMGAGNRQRMKKILGICLILVSVVGLVLGNGFVFFGQQLLGIYSSDPEVIQYGLNRMHLICAPYFLCGLMDVMVGSMRGMGYSFLPMIVSLIGACGLRVVWIFTVFQWHRSLFTLYLSYPITWTITALAHMACWYVVMYKKQPK